MKKITYRATCKSRSHFYSRSKKLIKLRLFINIDRTCKSGTDFCKCLYSILLSCSVFIIALALISCSPKDHNDQDKNYENIKPKRIIKDRILIVLGKDYSKRKNILKYLETEYGINKDGAPVQIITYEDMTVTTKLPRLKLITEKIEEHNSTILISIGIPEGGAYYLINALEKNKNLVVISLLPMDDILALEAGSDLVVDFEIPTDIMSDEKDFNISDDEVRVLLTASVFTGEYFHAKNKNLEKAPIEEFSEAFFNTQKVLDKKVFDGDYSIKAHIDPDTKIPSLKYLLIYENLTKESKDKKDSK